MLTNMLPFIRLLEIGIGISCYTTTQNNPSVTNQDDSELLVLYLPGSSVESGDAATQLSLHKVQAAQYEGQPGRRMVNGTGCGQSCRWRGCRNQSSFPTGHPQHTPAHAYANVYVNWLSQLWESSSSTLETMRQHIPNLYSNTWFHLGYARCKDWLLQPVSFEFNLHINYFIKHNWASHGRVDKL